ncbi:methyltransferase domain containing protein [Nitzschia inconspicua]|uniref:Methyltransferase domain containing protein n=1 Tax=Nitzschia inconspicua TaxID=303405 RepID=A0A9K3KJ65_9STRA|nr:methyltransferase domain containing protein [Nitzschia inconspicua]
MTSTAAADTVESKSDENVYETTSSLNQYLMLHFPFSGSGDGIPFIYPHANAPKHGLTFPRRVAEAMLDLYIKVNPESTSFSRALDIGCAVGGTSFELAQHFERADAFDNSENFIRVANQMKNMEPVSFQIPMEGDISETVVCQHDPDIDKKITDRVKFFVGDACRMPEMMKPSANGAEPLLKSNSYDGIVLANLLCRLPDPISCLEALPRLLLDHGVILIATPFTWLEEFTPRDKWLGGYYGETAGAPLASDNDDEKGTFHPKKRRKNECWSSDGLQKEMERLGFVNVSRAEMPLVIREHQRKYQYIISEVTGWKKRSEQ